MKLLRFMLLLPMLSPLTACGLSGGPVVGRVVEEGTNKPIPGAIVVVRWRGDLPGFADSRTVCYHVASKVTDEAGRYRIPAWSKEAEKDWQKRIINKELVINAHKAGYEWSRKLSPKEGTEYLLPSKGTSTERMEYLLRVLGVTSCGSQDESEKSLITVRKALYEEARALAQTESEKKSVEYILYRLEILELGFETAEKRYLQRGSR